MGGADYQTGKRELLRSSYETTKRAIAQLLALERSTSRLGKDFISHPPGGHDDLINAAAGALVLVSRSQILEGVQGHSPRKGDA